MGVRLGSLSDTLWWPPPLLLLLLLCTAPCCSGRPFGIPVPSVNVAVVFSGATYQAEIKGRLSRENFMDLPLEVNPITVLVNNTNPRTLLTRICDTLSTNRVHGIVFEDNVGSEAVAQILDFISTQTTVPIVGISGGSAVVLPHKVSEGAKVNTWPKVVDLVNLGPVTGPRVRTNIVVGRVVSQGALRI